MTADRSKSELAIFHMEQPQESVPEQQRVEARPRHHVCDLRLRRSPSWRTSITGDDIIGNDTLEQSCRAASRSASSGAYATIPRLPRPPDWTQPSVRERRLWAEAIAVRRPAVRWLYVPGL